MRSRRMICRPVSESSWPVGSSAISSCGLPARARAMATRCCWPPDSSLGRWRGVLGEADDRSIVATRSSRCAAADAGDAQRDPDVLGGGQHRDEPEGLEDEARPCSRRSSSAPARSCAVTSRRRPARTVPLVGRVEAADDVQQRGLAGAGPAAQRRRAAPRRMVKRHPRSACTAVCRAEGPGYVADRHHDLRGASTVPAHDRPASPSRSCRPPCRGPPARRRPLWVGRARRRCGRVPARSRTRSACRAPRVISRGSWTRPARSSTAYSTACRVALPCSSAPSWRSVSLLVRPSRIATVRRTWADTAGSWVTTSTVTPSSALAVCSAANTSLAVALSSSPVGSSASSTCGSFASAVAIAVRCCSPPDIWPGLRPAQCATPSTLEQLVGAAGAAAGARARRTAWA